MKRCAPMKTKLNTLEQLVFKGETDAKEKPTWVGQTK